MRLFRLTGFLGLLLLFQACGSDSAYILKSQYWQGIEISVEIRPSEPRVGMNEFLVVATKQKNERPAYDLIVSLKTPDADHWEQSIQDGDSGVYRRAIRINDPKHGVLQVLLQRDKQRMVLNFPLALTIHSAAAQAHSNKPAT